MGKVLEIHKYKGDAFMYVVASTNKHSENDVKNDTEKMNNMLSPEMKSEGIHYVFAISTADRMTRKTGEQSTRRAKGKQDTEESGSPLAIVNS
jgi:hypothetical protein